MRIRKVFMEQGGARYIPKQNIIYYDEILDKFPKLKKKLIPRLHRHQRLLSPTLKGIHRV